MSTTLDLVVEIEETSYRVPEGDKFVEVCAVLSNPSSAVVTLLVSAVESDTPQAKGIYLYISLTVVGAPSSWYIILAGHNSCLDVQYRNLGS